MPANTVYKRSDGRLGYKYTDRLGNRRELVSRKREGVQAFKKRCSDTETSGQDLIKMTFGELYQKWRDDYQAVNCGPADIASSEYIYTQFVEKKFAHIKITEIERKDINALLVELFKQDYAKTKATMLPPVVEFLAAYIARSKQDRTKFIREVAKQPKDFALDQVSWVPLRSVFWSAPGTVNKLSGAYFADGVVSALVNPNNKVEKVESILRA